MSEFVEVALLEKVPVGSSRAFTVAGKQIALFNVGGAIYAVLDSCLHKGTPLSYGPLRGKVVTCPWHGWCFDVTTGAMLNVPSHRVPSYETKVEDGKIFVSIA